MCKTNLDFRPEKSDNTVGNRCQWQLVSTNRAIKTRSVMKTRGEATTKSEQDPVDSTVKKIQQLPRVKRAQMKLNSLTVWIPKEINFANKTTLQTSDVT
jgi:hypothetical protein